MPKNADWIGCSGWKKVVVRVQKPNFDAQQQKSGNDCSYQSVSLSDYDKLKKKHDLLNEQVLKLVSRDIDIEDLRHENSILTKDIENLSNRNQSLENQHEKLQYELSNAKREFAKRSSKVVNISDRLK